MEITKEFLLSEIAGMEKQRNHAHDVAVAAQAAIDTLKAMIARLEYQEPVGGGPQKELRFRDLGLPDPLPIEGTP